MHAVRWDQRRSRRVEAGRMWWARRELGGWYMGKGTREGQGEAGRDRSKKGISRRDGGTGGVQGRELGKRLKIGGAERWL